MIRQVRCPNTACTWYGQDRAATPGQVGPDLLQAGPIVCVCGSVVWEPARFGDQAEAKPVPGPGTF